MSTSNTSAEDFMPLTLGVDDSDFELLFLFSLSFFRFLLSFSISVFGANKSDASCVGLLESW